MLDYLYEVGHAATRIARLDLAIEEAVKLTPLKMRAVTEAMQTLRGVAQVTAVTIVAEVGQVSRFSGARQLMGYGGIVASIPREKVAGEHHQDGCDLNHELAAFYTFVGRKLLFSGAE